MDDISTIRNLIPIGVAVVTLVGAWFAMKYGQRENAAKIGVLKEEFEKALTVVQDRQNSLADQVKAQWQKTDETRVEAQQFETTIEWIKYDIGELKDEEKWRRRNPSK